MQCWTVVTETLSSKRENNSTWFYPTQTSLGKMCQFWATPLMKDIHKR